MLWLTAETGSRLVKLGYWRDLDTQTMMSTVQTNKQLQSTRWRPPYPGYFGFLFVQREKMETGRASSYKIYGADETRPFCFALTPSVFTDNWSFVFVQYTTSSMLSGAQEAGQNQALSDRKTEWETIALQLVDELNMCQQFSHHHRRQTFLLNPVWKARESLSALPKGTKLSSVLSGQCVS